MKHFTKKLSWLLAFVLIFTNLVFTGMPVLAASSILIDESTDAVLVTGTDVSLEGYSNLRIRYYESDVSNTVLYEDNSMYGSTIGIFNIAIKPYAWHIKFVEVVENQAGTGGNEIYCFKAYPDTSLEVPTGTIMTFPEGTTLTSTEGEIYPSIYVGTTPLKSYSIQSSNYTLPSASQLRSDISDFDTNLETAGYNLPTLTKLYYTVELIDSISLKLTLAPTVSVILSANSGIPSLEGEMYATPYDTIDNTKLPTVSLEGADFYGWRISGSDYYVYKANVTDTSYLTPRVSKTCQLTAMYKERNPTFKLDLTNNKVKGLKPARTYAYPKYDWGTGEHTTIATDANGEFLYNSLQDFEPLAQLRLNSTNTKISFNSDYISLKHNRPITPVVDYTITTARVTNTSEFEGCEFAIRAASDSSDLIWGTSSEFTGLTPETSYTLYVKHAADENGFESSLNLVAFTTLAAKAVSNDSPNGVTIAAIPDQTHTGRAIEPTLVIKDVDKTLVQGTDYTVVYSNNTNVGTATVTVTFYRDYSGTMTKNFNISPAPIYTPPSYTAPTTYTYTVMFNTDGGSIIDSKTIKEGTTIGEIPVPTKDGYVFAGWYSNKELTKSYDAGTKITASTTLYAKWTKVESEPVDNSKKELVLTIGKKEANAFGTDIINDVAPMIRNNRTVLPAKFIAESLGAEVTWNGKNREVTIKGKNEKGEDVTIIIFIDSDFAYVNGKKVKLDSPAFIKNNRTYTPVKFIAENLGASVEWIKEEQKVVITKR